MTSPIGEGRWYKDGVFHIVGGSRPIQDNDGLELLIALSPSRKRQVRKFQRSLRQS